MVSDFAVSLAGTREHGRGDGRWLAGRWLGRRRGRRRRRGPAAAAGRRRRPRRRSRRSCRPPRSRPARRSSQGSAASVTGVPATLRPWSSRPRDRSARPGRARRRRPPRTAGRKQSTAAGSWAQVDALDRQHGDLAERSASRPGQCSSSSAISCPLAATSVRSPLESAPRRRQPVGAKSLSYGVDGVLDVDRPSRSARSRASRTVSVPPSPRRSIGSSELLVTGRT